MNGYLLDTNPDSSTGSGRGRMGRAVSGSRTTLDLGDALIAGIARANDLAIATRNARDL